MTIPLENIDKIRKTRGISISRLLKVSDAGKYEAVIFDLHHTILRLYPSRGKIYQNIFRTYGLNISPLRIERAFRATWRKYGDKKIAKEMIGLTSKNKNEQWWSNFHGQMLQSLGYYNHKKVAQISLEISKKFYSDPQCHRPYHDAIAILKLLRQKGIPMALASNGYHTTRRIIRAYSLERYFRYIFLSEETGISKPDPKAFITCAKFLGVATKKVLVVGDSYTCDILGAKNAGCGAAIIDRANRKDKKHKGCIYLNNLHQIRGLV
ncbi:MAG: HAD-IA family hydrolase [Patescibacteria group bacterium]